MSWRVLVKPLSTADVAGNVVSQKFRHPSKSMVVSGVQAGFAFFNNPAFADLKMRIYSDRGGSPGKMIAESSTAWTKAQVRLADDYGLKFAGWLFDDVPLQANVWYHLVLVPSTYTGSDASYIAWRYSYPAPQYPMNIDEDTANAGQHHLEFSLYGYSLRSSE